LVLEIWIQAGDFGLCFVIESGVKMELYLLTWVTAWLKNNRNIH